MPFEREQTRLGFHYFPNTLHYREKDLAEWLPVLVSLGANWVVLVTSLQRAIPEHFLTGLINAGINPILRFQSKIDSINPQEIRFLLETYARWGIEYIAFFDRPNVRTSWPIQNWTQLNLVERFLDIYLPLAETASQAGLTPIFPPLEPGGDYWDTAFLRTSLESTLRRGYKDLLEKMVLGAYSWSSNRSLNWGAGGPEKWPNSFPYRQGIGGEDHRGFRIFDWYQAISQAVLGKSQKIIIMGAGSHLGDHIEPNFPPIDEERHAQVNLAIAQAMTSPSPELLPPGMETIPLSVLCCNFWILAAESNSPELKQAWYQSNGRKLEIVDHLKNWIHTRYVSLHKPDPLEAFFSSSPKPIRHYLLLPSFAWGTPSWHLEVIQPFVQRYQPTVGFSIQEAVRAEQVTIIGSAQSYPPNTIELLISAGCSIQQIDGNGTEIASKLAEI